MLIIMDGLQLFFLRFKRLPCWGGIGWVCLNCLRIFQVQRKNVLYKLKFKQSKTSGFTLVELLITMSVLALMIAFAIPEFRTMILNTRLTANTDSLISTLNYARGMALYNNATVQVCPFSTPNSITCGNNWSTGWIVVTQPTLGTGILLKSQQNNSSGPVIQANTATVRFDSHGLAAAQTNFTICDTRGNSYGRSVEVMTTGFIQSGQTPGQAVWNNNPIICP